jgi:hypothetical protein
MLELLPQEILITHILPGLSSLSELCLAATCKALRMIVEKIVRSQQLSVSHGRQSSYSIQWSTLYSLKQWPVLRGRVGIDFWLIRRMDFKWIKYFGAENIRKRMLDRTNNWHYSLGTSLKEWIMAEVKDEDRDDAYDKLVALANDHLLPHVNSKGHVLFKDNHEKAMFGIHEIVSGADLVSNGRLEPTRQDQALFIKALFQQRFHREMDDRVETWVLMNIEYN